MKARKQERREAKQLFQVCLVNGLLDEGRVRQTVQALVQKKPRGYMGILSHLHRLAELAIARRKVTVESAVAVPEGLKRGLEENLARRHGAGLRVQYAENSALLGGLRIQVGNDVYDGSVRSRLAELQETF